MWFHSKLEEAGTAEVSIWAKLLESKAITEKATITEDDLRQLLSQFEDHVAKRDIPEIKKFIASYVEKVIVYEKNVEVIFKVQVVWIWCMEARGVELWSQQF